MDSLTLVYTTIDSCINAEKIVKELLGEKLIACANIFHNVKSMYLWQGKVCSKDEVVVIVKSLSTLVNDIITKIKRIHPYKTPGIVTMPINIVDNDFYMWVYGCVS